MIGQQLDAYLQEYTQAQCAEPIGEDHPHRRTYFQRIWGSWSHHWQQAAADGSIDGAVVAEQIRRGRGYSGSGRLGGNPLRDVVLAEAVERKDPVALSSFETDYKGFSVGLAVKVNRRVADDPDDWWYCFLDELGGYSDPPGKLSKFGGRCGLKNWLGTVARNFARRHPPQTRQQIEREAKEAEDTRHVATPKEDASIQPLATVLRGALDQLTAQQRLVLCLRFAEDLPNKETAGVLGIHKGRVSHRQVAAIDKLEKAVQQIVENHADRETYEESRDALSDLPNLRQFAFTFCQQLREMVPEEEQVGTERRPSDD